MSNLINPSIRKQVWSVINNDPNFFSSILTNLDNKFHAIDFYESFLLYLPQKQGQLLMKENRMERRMWVVNYILPKLKAKKLAYLPVEEKHKKARDRHWQKGNVFIFRAVK